MSGISGLHQVEANISPPPKFLATRVTGRNFAAISYLVSIASERLGVAGRVTAQFAKTGDLVRVDFNQNYAGPGDYIILKQDGELVGCTQRHYDRYYRVVK